MKPLPNTLFRVIQLGLFFRPGVGTERSLAGKMNVVALLRRSDVRSSGPVRFVLDARQTKGRIVKDPFLAARIRVAIGAVRRRNRSRRNLAFCGGGWRRSGLGIRVGGRFVLMAHQ